MNAARLLLWGQQHEQLHQLQLEGELFLPCQCNVQGTIAPLIKDALVIELKSSFRDVLQNLLQVPQVLCLSPEKDIV